jgi:hypothetical protein
MIQMGVGRYGIRRRLCGYQLGCGQYAVTWGYNAIMKIVPVCRDHKIRKVEGSE